MENFDWITSEDLLRVQLSNAFNRAKSYFAQLYPSGESKFENNKLAAANLLALAIFRQAIYSLQLPTSIRSEDLRNEAIKILNRISSANLSDLDFEENAIYGDIKTSRSVGDIGGLRTLTLLQRLGFPSRSAAAAYIDNFYDWVAGEVNFISESVIKNRDKYTKQKDGTLDIRVTVQHQNPPKRTRKNIRSKN